jgi:hypothetical protein
MRPVTDRHNLHTIYMREGLLCVECRACGNRGIVKPPDARAGNMKPITELKLVCNECGGREIARYLPTDKADAEAFVAGG